MPLTKFVNGVAVEMSPAEETALLAEWAAADAAPPKPWRVPLSLVYSRLSAPNKTTMRSFMNANPETEERFREQGGVPSDHVGVRNWLTANGEDPDAVLAL